MSNGPSLLHMYLILSVVGKVAGCCQQCRILKLSRASRAFHDGDDVTKVRHDH